MPLNGTLRIVKIVHVVLHLFYHNTRAKSTYICMYTHMYVHAHICVCVCLFKVCFLPKCATPTKRQMKEMAMTSHIPELQQVPIF